MADGVLPDGSAQCFYFPEGHERAGGFEGMAEILKECGFEGCEKLCAECPNFRCNPNINHCCCRRLLYNQLDFLNIKSNIELACEKHNYTKSCFCWNFIVNSILLSSAGDSPSSCINNCHLACLRQCSCRMSLILSILFHLCQCESEWHLSIHYFLGWLVLHRFATWSLCFMDTYRKGLNGKQAAFTTKKYCSHRTLPLSVFDDLAELN